MTDWTTDTPSTCCTYGEEIRECEWEDCDYIERRSLTTYDSSNHSGGSHWEENPSATCTNAGLNEQICDGCSEVLQTILIHEKGHNMDTTWYTYEESTCCTYGTERNNCLECDYYDERPLTTYDSSNHSGGSHWEEDPSATCTNEGLNKQICNGCLTVLYTASIPAPGHSMGSWYTVTESTCNTNGTQRRDCSECSHYEVEPLDILPHTMSGWSVIEASTCCTTGSERSYCSGCSYFEERTIDENPANHSGGTYWSVTTAATCTASGIRSQKCYGCGAVLSTQTIPILDHSWGSWIYQYRYYDEDLQYYVRVYTRTCSSCGAVEYDYLE
jgi:hypothetical protein